MRLGRFMKAATSPGPQEPLRAATPFFVLRNLQNVLTSQAAAPVEVKFFDVEEIREDNNITCNSSIFRVANWSVPW